MKFGHMDSDYERELQKEVAEFVKSVGTCETLASCLLRLMDAKGMEAPQVYRNAELDRQLYDKLIQLRTPCRASKKTLLRICIGLSATVDEAKHILATCGFTFDMSRNEDKSVLFCLRTGRYTMYDVYEVLGYLNDGLEDEKQAYCAN